MKKQLFLLLSALILAALPAFAYSFSAVAPTGQTLYYTISNNTAKVTYPSSSISNPWSGYTQPGGSLTIPSSVTHNDRTYSVTSIGERAFYNCSGLTSVTIPNSVTSIGGSAFCYCSGLTSLTIPNSVTSIGNSAFSGCSGLTSVTIPNSVTSIGEYDFSGCSGLTSLTIGSSVTSIGERAFYNCSGLTSVTIPNSVTSIGNDAFYGCSSLTSLTIGNSVTSIGSSAFYGCSNVDTLYYNAKNCSNSSFSSNSGTTYESYGFRPMKSSLSVLVIGDSVQSIPSAAFYGCSGLTSVTIPNSVTSIGSSAFSGCSGLTSVTIGTSVTSIGSSAFRNCSGLTSLSIGSSVTSIGASAFSGCSGLTSLTIPNSVTSIGNYAFDGCSGLTSLTIPNSVTSIGERAFYNCSGLTSVTIPNSVTSIGGSAFRNCSGLTSVTIGNSVTSIGSYAFEGCSNVDTLYYNAKNCSSSFGTSSYCGFRPMANSLSVLVIGDSVQTIPSWAFYGCSGLTSVTIPNSITSIGSSAFRGCSGLTSVTIGNSVTSIGSSAFEGCSNVDTLYYNAKNCSNSSFSSSIYSGFRPMANSLSVLVIGDSVQTIPSYAFYGCSGLTSVTIGTSVTSIGNYAFDGCSNLDTIFAFNEVPATLGQYTFPSASISIVPCTSVSLYEDAGWPNVQSLDAIPNYVFIADADQGIVSDRTMPPFCPLRAVTFEATPNYGYHFTQWSDGDTNNPRTITLTQDTAFVAQFDSNTYTITVVSANEVMGIATGDTTQKYLTTAIISATSNYGYHFAQWNDGDTNNPRTILVDGDKNYTAQFDHNTYILSAVSQNDVFGSVLGAGSYNYLNNCSITATPNYGYHFTQWSDGDTNNPRTITLTQDTAFVAQFDSNTYTITVVTANEDMGYVTGSASQKYLTTAIISATSNYGYHFAQWNDGDTNNPRTILVDGDKNYTAQFGYNTYTITATSQNDVFGSVSGAGSYNYLNNCSITATSNYGYHFIQWSDGDTNNPRSITLTQDTAFVAQFVANQYNLAVSSNNAAWGSATGSGTFSYLDTVIVTATPSAHYHLVRWSDGSRENPHSVIIRNDSSITAFFAIDTFAISATSNDIARGSVTGGGTFTYGETVTLTATAYSGYIFGGWSNGMTYNPYTFAALADMDLVANFIEESSLQYLVTVTSNNNQWGTVTGGGNYYNQSIVTISATPNEGYHFTQWSDGNTENPRTFTLTQDTAFVAQFMINQYTLTVTSNNNTWGSVTGGGTFNFLDTVTVSATPSDHCHLLRWSDGSRENPHTVIMRDDTSITAFFAIDTVVISASSNDIAKGMVTGGGAFTYGETVTLTASANTGFIFDSWSNGATDNPYTFVATENMNLVANFIEEAAAQYLVTVSSNNNQWGTVTGGGIFFDQSVVSISATPNEGYYFVSWNDCSTLNPRAITVSQDSSFTAIFASLVDTVAMCPDAFPFTYGDTIFNTNTQEGDYPVHFSTIQGCDSIVTLTLQFLPTYRHNDSLTLCYSMMPYNYGGYILNTDLETGNHDIPLRSALGCDSTIALNLTVHASENSQLCMVSVENELNTLRWNKEVPVEYYKIYREGVSAGEYDLLDSIPSSASSSWVDQEANPRARSYRYRISSVDSCGNESELSNVHKTMHLTISRGLNNSWNLVWTEYEGASYSTYKIYRGTNPSDLTEIDVLPAGGNTTYTDENAPSSGNVYYQVGIVLNQPCNDAKAAELVLSNQATNSTEDIHSTILNNATIATNGSQILVSNAANQRIRIFDNLGRIISTTLNAEETSIFDMPASGVYLVQVGNAPAEKVVLVR